MMELIPEVNEVGVSANPTKQNIWGLVIIYRVGGAGGFCWLCHDKIYLIPLRFCNFL